MSIQFFQILIIHSYDIETKIKLPVFFILIISKTSEIYNSVFLNLKNILLNKGFNIKLEIFHSDFKRAIINTFKNNFKNIKFIGCYFHFVKSI